MAISSIEAVDLLRFADAFSDKLASATAELSRKRGLEREKAWIEAALGLVDDARKQSAGMVDRARGLPELSELREEFAASLQNAWIDALEKLVAGITFHVSGRAPIIEALFPHQKFAPLRKAPREIVEKFNKDFEKRLKSGYVNRMLATDDFAFAKPVLEHVAKCWSEFIGSFNAEGLPPDAAFPIRTELIAAAERVELAIRQARLLAEAALVPVNGAFDAAGLAMKPKKRTKVAAAIDVGMRADADADADLDSEFDDDEADELSAETDEDDDDVDATASSESASDGDAPEADGAAGGQVAGSEAADSAGDGASANDAASSKEEPVAGSTSSANDGTSVAAERANEIDASTADATARTVEDVVAEAEAAADAAETELRATKDRDSATTPAESTSPDATASASASSTPSEPVKKPRKKKAAKTETTATETAPASPPTSPGEPA